MGALVGNVCYSDTAQAVDAYFSSIAPILSGTQTISYQRVGLDWQYCTTDGFGVTCVPTVLPNLPGCDHLAGFNDGLMIGGALAAAIAIVYAIHFLVRGR